MTGYREEETITRTETVEPAYTDHGHRRTLVYSGGPSIIERAVIFIFGVIQALLLIRIVLLLLAAREGNAIVAFVYDITEIFVAPFRGVLGMDHIAAGQAELDLSAVVALIGWTLIELLVLGLIRLFRPTRTA
ncbi:MAG TPA: YggT family protein [Candidatus Limnocylindria bacterium]|jgi:uncharacterized protein YggT (Ycf19 family)|nr:YggT family protein [Candidatus Limnocylindria bacterium]